MSTQSTTLNLLTRDGAICATFTPPLNADQYDQLLKAVEQDGNTEASLRARLRSKAPEARSYPRKSTS